MQSITLDEAKSSLAASERPPDDLNINNKAWKLECTYLTKKDAQGSADLLSEYRLFPYKGGFALYERNYDPIDPAIVVDWANISPLERRLELQGEKFDPSSIKAVDACGLIEWFREQISDENMASFDYSNQAAVFKDKGMPIFASALNSISKDESRHKLMLETIIEVITEKYRCS